jgi:hypothetical protein
MSRATRLLIAFSLAIACTVLTALPAHAHSGGGATASDYRTTISGVSPALRDAKVSVKEHGDRLQLENNSNVEMLVLGYQDEPYIKVTPSGVWENRLSPAVYTNADRYGTTEPPDFADAAAPPDWRKVSSGSVAVWHDHRAHWMSESAPPVVQGNREIAHMLIPDWTVPLRVDGVAVTVTGDVEWIPPGPKLRWVPLVLGTAAVVAVVAWRKSLTAAVVTGVTAVVLADVLHVIGVFLASAGRLQARLGAAVTGDAASLVVWVTAAWVVYAARRRQTEVVAYAGLFVASVVWLLGGLTDLSTLWSSQVTFSWPWWIARATVATTLGAGAATMIAAGLLIYRSVAGTGFADGRNDHRGAPGYEQNSGNADEATS